MSMDVSTAPAQLVPNGVRLRGRYRELEVILKTSERCNLACSYCYYFFGGDESYLDRPPLISSEVVARTGAFLREGVEATDIPSIKLVFHGGEPMLQRPAAFDATCVALREAIGDVARLQLFIQTNGTILSEAWIATLAKHEVNVCVSLDGDAALHDRYRVDKKGRGSFDKIAKNIARLREASSIHPGLYPRALTVLRSGYDYRSIVSYLVDELGIVDLNTLLPDCCHDDGIPEGASAEGYGEILCSLLDLCKERPELRFRELDIFLSAFRASRKQASTYDANPVIIVQSDGDLTIDDSYIPAKTWRSEMPVGSVFDTTLAEWLSAPIFDQIYTAMKTLPDGCRECVWRGPCKGGALENRYSSEAIFNNPSVYCGSLQMFYLEAAKHLARSGYPVERMMSALGLEEAADGAG